MKRDVAGCDQGTPAEYVTTIEWGGLVRLCRKINKGCGTPGTVYEQIFKPRVAGGLNDKSEDENQTQSI